MSDITVGIGHGHFVEDVADHADRNHFFDLEVGYDDGDDETIVVPGLLMRLGSNVASDKGMDFQSGVYAGLNLSAVGVVRMGIYGGPAIHMYNDTPVGAGEVLLRLKLTTVPRADFIGFGGGATYVKLGIDARGEAVLGSGVTFLFGVAGI